MENIQNEILTILLETLKEQANKYKIIVQDSSLTHEQRKEFDTEISQMYKVLADMSASSTVYTIAELQALKVQYKTKLDEFETILNNIDTSNLTLTPEQIESLKGENGISFTYDMFTAEQLQALKGADGKDGKSLTYEDLTEQQKVNLISYFNNSSTIEAINSTLSIMNNQLDINVEEIYNLQQALNLLNARVLQLENNQNNTVPTLVNTSVLNFDFKTQLSLLTDYEYTENEEIDIKIDFEYNSNSYTLNTLLFVPSFPEELPPMITIEDNNNNYMFVAFGRHTSSGKLLIGVTVFDTSSSDIVELNVPLTITITTTMPHNKINIIDFALTEEDSMRLM